MSMHNLNSLSVTRRLLAQTTWPKILFYARYYFSFCEQPFRKMNVVNKPNRIALEKCYTTYALLSPQLTRLLRFRCRFWNSPRRYINEGSRKTFHIFVLLHKCVGNSQVSCIQSIQVNILLVFKIFKVEISLCREITR